jgi:hypothetical protein
MPLEDSEKHRIRLDEDLAEFAEVLKQPLTLDTLWKLQSVCNMLHDRCECAIHAFRSGSVSLYDVQGINITGDMSSEDYVRQLRDGTL